MNKKTTGIVVVIVVLIAGFFLLNNYIYNEKQAVAVEDFKEIEFVIDGNRIQLTDGIAETDAAPNSASKVVTRYFGNEFVYDLNNDGKPDAIFLVTNDGGGSGTFFYVVGAVNTDDGYVGTEAYLLGDRIAPQTTEASRNPNHRNVIVVNYAERATGEPMTAQPSVGKSVYLKLDPDTLRWGVVEPNFEGEADVSRMSLTMKKWMWVRTTLNDGREILPKKQDLFALSFSNDGTFSATTDCNGIGGEYLAEDNSITFSKMVSTLMYCEGSQEAEFSKYLTDATGYQFTSRGELVLNLKFDSGSVIFK